MTIYDIAKMAGVSASSVSRVVNGKPGVNRATREKIQALLKEHNYVPDTNARNLVTQSNRTIGILTDDIDTLHQVEGCHRVEYELMRNGYYCFVKYIGHGPDAIETAMLDLARHRVEGAVCLGSAFRDARKVTRAVEHHLPNTPVVMVHNTLTFPRPNIYSVGADEVAGIQSCVDYLTSRGRRQMLLVINENRVSGALIRSAFESAVKRYPHVHSTVYTGVPVSVDGGESFALRMLREQPDTDGIICANDLIAIGVLNILKEQGIQVPQQISLMGENNSSFCDLPPAADLAGYDGFDVQHHGGPHLAGCVGGPRTQPSCHSTDDHCRARNHLITQKSNCLPLYPRQAVVMRSIRQRL